MGWVVGEGAHILGADIEQMGGIARRIGEADAKVTALLDQCHAGCSSGLFEEVYSQQDAACSATDDDDVHIRNSLVNVVFHYMIAEKGESRVFDFCSEYYKFSNSVDKINITKYQIIR